MRVIAPASPFDLELFSSGVAFLERRYEVELGEHVRARQGFLAGTDAQRLADLDDALAADVRAVIAARGGYGLTRIAHLANWAAFQRSPKWLVGYSDITLLHQEAQRAGVCSLHADNATGLGKASDSAGQAWLRALEYPLETRTLFGRGSLGSGSVGGPLLGGNLTLLFTAQAAGRLFLPPGCILALEDVTEASYRVDRMLSALQLSGALAGVAGVALGDFTDCGEGPHGVPIEAVLLERFTALGLPTVHGFEFGHGNHNTPLPLGLDARLDTEARTLSVGARAA